VVANRKNSGLRGAVQIEDIIDHLLVQFDCDILQIMLGRVSTETDACRSIPRARSTRRANWRSMAASIANMCLIKSRPLGRINAAEQL
jgi:hypothetical protein